MDCSNANGTGDRLARTLGRGEKGEILDRLEIFNSVQVRAPAIELDQSKTAEKSNSRDAGKFISSGRRGFFSFSVNILFWCFVLGKIVFVYSVNIFKYTNVHSILSVFSVSTPSFPFVSAYTLVTVLLEKMSLYRKSSLLCFLPRCKFKSRFKTRPPQATYRTKQTTALRFMSTQTIYLERNPLKLLKKPSH